MLTTVKRCTKVTHRTHKFVRGYAGGCNEATIVTPEVIKTKLKAKLKVKDLLVEDSSGNGSFFQIQVSASDFKGLSLVKQHQLVNQVLKEELDQIHGLSLKTVVPEDL